MNKKWKIGWGITNKCNMNCEFCYSKNARLNEEVTDFKTNIRFIENNYRFIDSINYGTGENTIDEDWYKLVIYISEKFPQIQQALTTNGYLSESIKNVKNKSQVLRAISELDVSIDFSKPEKHNKFRGNKNAFRWAVDSLELCAKNDIIPTIVIMAIDETMQIQNLDKIIEIAQKYNAYIRINIFRPNSHQKIKLLTYKTLKEALFHVINKSEYISLCDPLFSALIQKKQFEDTTGTTSLRILPDGSITPSTYLVDEKWRTANIADVDLNTLDFKIVNYETSKTKYPKDCQDCTLNEICKGGAIDRRFIWYNNLNMKDPYCPLNNNDKIETWSKNFENKKNEIRPSIHDGYLPTLIFKP